MLREWLQNRVTRQPVQIHSTPLGEDAWGRSKAITDYSLLRGLWTFNIDSAMWIEYYDGAEISIANSASVNGALEVQGVDGHDVRLSSKRHPRYQPGKGHLYSSSVILPDFNVACDQDFGLMFEHSGIFFRANAGKLYVVRRTMTDGVVTEDIRNIKLDGSIDLTKGNVFDIQLQWRGIGNIFFFINQKKVYTMDLLGSLTGLSLWNPALPISFQVNGAAKIIAGCVDVSTEGGYQSTKLRGNIDTGQVTLGTTAELPVLLVHIPMTVVYNTVDTHNTVDLDIDRIAGFADDSTVMRVYVTRDASHFTGSAFTAESNIGYLEHAVGTDITLVSTPAETIITRRIQANNSIEIVNPNPSNISLYLAHGDYLLVTMQAKNSTVGNASIEWGAEI